MIFLNLMKDALLKMQKKVEVLFGNLEIGAEVDCELGDGLRERFEDPTSLAMLGLVVTVGATMLQMLRGN